MEKFKNYLTKFVKEEDGFEILQVAIIVAIVAGLAAVLYIKIVQPMNQKLEEASEAINNITPSANGDV